MKKLDKHWRAYQYSWIKCPLCGQLASRNIALRFIKCKNEECMALAAIAGYKGIPDKWLEGRTRTTLK